MIEITDIETLMFSEDEVLGALLVGGSLRGPAITIKRSIWQLFAPRCESSILIKQMAVLPQLVFLTTSTASGQMRWHYKDMIDIYTPILSLEHSRIRPISEQLVSIRASFVQSYQIHTLNRRSAELHGRRSGGC
ncbi:hypothetical protein EVAR_66224_1 [Eumeta japonica]|uniref:Uncharacterized protein n=1 Tax=Eumeta variegata TaxID=151549 RepID=A0A4C2ADC2_EUMVA|nr:hypothetical protein EVAR_66224_1 [Eumeta japonica]